MVLSRYFMPFFYLPEGFEEGGTGGGGIGGDLSLKSRLILHQIALQLLIESYQKIKGGNFMNLSLILSPPHIP